MPARTREQGRWPANLKLWGIGFEFWRAEIGSGGKLPWDDGGRSDGLVGLRTET
jgi:hypothetical protein